MYDSADEGLANETRDVTINIRAKKNQRDLIDRAAELQGKSRSEFMLESAQKTAQDVLLDQRFLKQFYDRYRFTASTLEPLNLMVKISDVAKSLGLPE
ncbi:DUF1778 domain-containing protein [Chamaesiphon sp. OTE_8_metabat_110]|uniref:type II toxin-antitoxin system TacA family antitoxin n=1 Tax=Chamaesiphon sp. OTE_8_metabat_110 TaxID=2964696 RepID=UPI00286B5288|nr:DUF1778 domain-containing protein [Chamaesiphon sp. OTE_8_metabat_110]